MESPLYEIAPTGLRIIETIGYAPNAGFFRLGAHIDRAEATATKLNYPFNRANCLQMLGDAVGDQVARVRLTIGREGDVDITTGPLAVEEKTWRVAISDARLASDDPWLRVKTTERGLYDKTRAELPDHIDEVIFLNEKDQLCEGTITNIFVHRDGKYLTPPLDAGCLPGVLRAALLSSGEAQEAYLDQKDLEDGFYVGNSLRGLIQAKLVEMG